MRTSSFSSFSAFLREFRDSFVALPIFPSEVTTAVLIETSLSEEYLDNFGIADSASFPIFPKDLTASRRILQSSSSRYSVILSTEFSPDFSPISPNTNIELNLIERISLSIFFITSPITDESFSILDKTKSILASLNNCSKEADILYHPIFLDRLF